MSKTRERPLDPAILGRLNEDNWKPRGNKATGNKQPYVTTNKGTMPGLPQEDEYNPGVMWCGTSKRVWVGGKSKGRFRRENTSDEKTQVRKLFELLYRTPGCRHLVPELAETVFGNRMGGGTSKAEMKRVEQKVRRLISKLKRRMTEYAADEDAIVVSKSYNQQPGYMLLFLKDQKYQKGQEPQPALKYIDRDDRDPADRQPADCRGIVLWLSKRLYLGEDYTYLRRLFHLLADQPGRWRAVHEIEDFVFGTRCGDNSDGVPEDDTKKAQQNLRRVISRLKGWIRKAGLDHEVILVPHRPGYMLLLIPDQKPEEGQSPQPEAQGK
jgi:hypothetical protein